MLERLETIFGERPNATREIESAKVVLAHLHQMTPPSDGEQKKVSLKELALAVADDVRVVDSRFQGGAVNYIGLFDRLKEAGHLAGPPYYMPEDARKFFEQNYGAAIK